MPGRSGCPPRGQGIGHDGAYEYLAAWVILPEEGEPASIAENIFNKKRPGSG
jgi:hypothetical protein